MNNYIKTGAYTIFIRKKSELLSWEVHKMQKRIHSAWEKDDEEEGIYSEDFRESLVEDGELDGWEAGWMSGYDEAG